MSNEVFDLLLKSIDEVKETLVSIDARLRKLETAIAEQEGRKKGLLTLKDIIVLICAAGAIVLAFFRLNQN